MGKRQRRRLREQRELTTQSRPDTERRRDPTGEATARLAQLVEQQSRLQLEIDAEVDELERFGFDWPTIAHALGVTRQAARQRYRRRHVV